MGTLTDVFRGKKKTGVIGCRGGHWEQGACL